MSGENGLVAASAQTPKQTPKRTPKAPTLDSSPSVWETKPGRAVAFMGMLLCALAIVAMFAMLGTGGKH